jgi:uncharacterized membrane protein YdbT with pleckstrin-like domain
MNSYVEEHLLPGEVILAQARLAPLPLFLPGVIVVLAGLLVSLAISGAAYEHSSALLRSWLIFWIVGGALSVRGFLQMMTADFGLTDRRVVAKVGALRHHSLEILLSQVEGISVDQGMFGRMFTYGNITVTGTGGSKDPFRGIADPFAFRKAVQAQLEVARNSAALSHQRPADSHTSPTASSLSTADELQKLVALREAGALTVEEFEGQKQKLLL